MHTKLREQFTESDKNKACAGTAQKSLNSMNSQ